MHPSSKRTLPSDTFKRRNLGQKRYGRICKTLTWLELDRGMMYKKGLVMIFRVLKSPASERDEKTLGYFCCVTGPISCSVRLAKTGFVEGETVMANVGINNQSNRVMEESTCRLLQKITYSSGNKKKVRLRDSCGLVAVFTQPLAENCTTQNLHDR